jgi:ABC-2 type transport system permease protein
VNSQTNAVIDSSLDSTAAARPTRPMYWSVRRELWENRSIYVAPLAAAAVTLFGFLISTIGMPQRRRAVLLLDTAHQRAAIETPYDVAAFMLLVTAFVVGVFYCLDALYGERRDRSILFWKSLPVSDRTTVLSKATVPLLILPVLTFVIIEVTHLIMLMMSAAVLLTGGLSLATISPQFRFVPSPLALLYGLTVITLWHAPLYGWLLLVSGWARRAAFLWAVLPFVALSVFERVAFGTSYVAKLMKYRLIGWFTEAFVSQAPGAGHQPTQLTPGRFLSTPGLWIGLAFAAAFLAAAVRLRRDREPI